MSVRLRLWQKMWLLFAAIWVAVAAIQVVTILAFSPDESEKALQPVVLAILVPAVFYGIGWLWQLISRWRELPPPEK